MARSIGFPPIACRDARVLVLGSLPGRVSLERREYYAQPQNAFWRVIEALFGIARTLDYAERTRRLAAERVALWDVCRAAERRGSLDSAIVVASVEPNDFASFLRVHREIALVCLNGAKAAELWGRLVRPTLPRRLATLPATTLPSTSPAHAGMPYATKLARWSVVRAAARTPTPRSGGA